MRYAAPFLAGIALLAALTGWTRATHAATCTSVAAGGNWNAPATWTGCAGGNGPVANTPGSADTAVVASAGTVTVNVALSVGVLTVNSGTLLQTGALTLSAATLSGTLNVSGGTMISNNTLTVNGPTNLSAGTLTPASNSARTFVGPVSISGGNWNGGANNRAATFRGGISVTGGTYTPGTGTMTFNTNAQSIGGTVAVTIPRITVTGITLTNSNSGGLSATISLNGTGTLLNAAGRTLSIGFAAAPGIATLNATAAGNTVNYNRAGAQTVKVTSYHNLTLSNANAKALGAVTAIAGNLSVTGSARINGNAAFTVGGAFNYASSGNTTLTAARPISIGAFSQTGTGTLNDNGNTITVTGSGPNIWLKTAGTFTTSGTTIFTGTAPQIGASNFRNLTINVGAGNTATLTGNASPAGNLSVQSGTFDLATFTANRALAGGTLSVANNATLRIGGTNGFPSNYAAVALGLACSTVEYGGAAQTVSAQSYGSLTLGGSGIKTMPPGALTLACDFSMLGTASATTANTLAVGRDFLHGGTAQFTAGNSVTVARDLTLGNGTTFGAAAFTHAVGRNFTNNGTALNPGASTFSFNGAQPQAIAGTAASTTFNHVATANASTAVTVSMPLVLNGSLVLGAGTSFNAGTFGHAVAGDFTNNTGNPANFVSGGTVTFNGAAQALDGGTATTFHHVATAATTSLTVSQAMTINGDLTLGGGTTINAGALNHSIAGQFSNNGGTLNPSTGTFTFNGSAPQMIGGTAATTFHNLTVNNAANVVLGANCSIANTLQFSAGLVVTGANLLTVGSSGATGTINGAGASSFVAGNLARGVPAGSPTVVWPVGSASPSAVYAPVSIAFNTVTAGGLLTVSTANGDHPSLAGSLLDPARSVNRRWTLANAGTAYVDASPTFTFVAGDIDGGANAANFLVGKYSAGNWSYPDVGTRTGTSTAASAILAGDGLGDFAIAEPGTLTAYSEYRMEQLLWNGTAGEVTDSGSGAHNGVAAGLGGTFPSTDNSSPAIPGGLGTCRYGVFNRANKQYLALPAGYPNLGASGSFTVSAWIRTTNISLPGQRIVADDENNSAGWGFSVGDGGAGKLRFYSRGTPSALILDTANVITAGNWFFVAAVADIVLKRKRIYVWNVAGTLVASVTSQWSEASFGSDAGIVSIGGETNASSENSSAYGFAGNLDYVRVHLAPLGKDQLNALRQSTHPCSSVDHYAISLPGGSTAVTCDPAQVTISAHGAGHGATAPLAGVVLSLNTSTGTGVWTQKDAGSGVFAPSGLNNGAATYTWPGGERSVTLRLRHNVATTLSVNVLDSNGKPEAPAEDPNLTFANAALRISNGANAPLAVGTQIAGKPSNVGFGGQSLFLQAIRTDTSTGACTSIFPNGSEVSFQVGAVCANPATCSQNVSLTTTASAGNSGAFVPGASGTYPATIAFRFTTANAEAPFRFDYADAGQIALQFRAPLPAPPAATFVAGTSSGFIVRPYGLRISGVTTSAAPAATDPVFAVAGNAFNTTVTAVRWQAGNDANADGVPDTEAEIASNPATPSFGAESAPGPAAATLSHTLNAPGGGASGTLSGASFTGFSSGSRTNAVTWSEVGFIDLFASSANYLGSGQNVTSSAAGLTGVGRFRPDHFTVTGAGAFAAGCASATPFTYLGQAFAINGVVMQARNASDVLTQNYTGAYARLAPATVAAWGLAARDTAGAGTPLTLDTSAAAVSGAWSSGAITAGFGGIAVQRPLGAPAGPYASAKIGIAPVDPDSVAIAAVDLDADGAGGDDHKQIGTTALIRFGRLRLRGAVGVSRQHASAPWLELNLPVRAEYWNGTAFALNTDDSCTTLDRSNIVLGAYGKQLAACETMVNRDGSATISLASGAASLKLSTPGVGNEGSVLLTPQLGATASGSYCPSVGGAPGPANAAAKSHLQGAWTGGSYDQNPSARAAFGVYGAQPPSFIFYREMY